MTPSEPFMLVANSVHEVQVYLSPKQKGSKYMYINVVGILCATLLLILFVLAIHFLLHGKVLQIMPY